MLRPIAHSNAGLTSGIVLPVTMVVGPAAETTMFVCSRLNRCGPSGAALGVDISDRQDSVSISGIYSW